ncbi:MAG: metallophosphoesterase [Clostridia bacterium]|nr:metallophosphoesterase [Clostridia bacterium]
MANSATSKKLKFLHCSDIHLDAPIQGMTLDKANERRREIRSTFMRMMEFVREREIDYVLIAGDLFDNDHATNATAEFLIREFRNCQRTKFIIAPGVSDCYGNNPIYQSGRLPDNCYVFASPSLCRFEFDEDRLAFYGWAHPTEGISVSPIADAHVEDGTRINIVCGYADLGGPIDSNKCPITGRDMNRFGADYYALGGRHAKTEFVKRSGAMYSYCGSLESTGFDNPDRGGVKLLNVDYDDGELSIDGKHVSFGRLKFVVEEIDITGVRANNEITNRISQLISSRKYGVETALRIELVGKVDPRFNVPKKFECDAFGLYFFDIVDKTLPLWGTEHFKRDMTVSGEIYRHFLPMLESEDEEERLSAARAFRAGLAALENRDIDV